MPEEVKSVEMTSSKETIINYYDSCESDYRFFWDLDRSHAMHAGFWDDTTRSLKDALARENEVLADLVNISSTDRVLDAGCGVGGSSLYLAEKRGCEVVGISLSEKQVQKACSLAEKKGLKNASFQVMDYTKTNFDSASFDVVWGIESICHTQDKSDFMREAKRLLKPEGRLVVADGFATRTEMTQPQKNEMKWWLNGWGVDSLDTQQQFENQLNTVGFKNVTYTDMTNHVFPSSRRLYYISFPAIALSKCGEWLGLRSKVQTSNLWAAYYQYRTLCNNLWQYGIFTAKV
jgi:cyclopropane fatty-acyl-phospholipid synthase-like methyltransferase